jgi:hypothetical protein
MNAEHVLTPKTEAEFELVLSRISELSRAVLTTYEWVSILNSARQLILKSTKEQLLVPDELDLDRFASSRRGKTLQTILQAFGSMETFSSNLRLSVGDWAQLLKIFTFLTVYVRPLVRIDFAYELCKRLRGSTGTIDVINCANTLVLIDPLTVKQTIPPKAVQDWCEGLERQLNERVHLGESIDSDTGEFQPEDYDDWRTESRQLLKTADAFYNWAIIDPPSAFGELENLIEIVSRPADEAVDQEPDDDYRPSTSTMYWSIERLFEDL